MEKKIKTVHETVKVEKEVYITKDYKTFYDEKEAIDHEKFLDSINEIDLEEYGFPNHSLMKFDSEDHVLKYEKYKSYYIGSWEYDKKHLSNEFPQWLIIEKTSEDGYGNLEYKSVDTILSNVKRLVNLLEKLK